MNVYSFGEDDVGNLFVVTGGGTIYRFLTVLRHWPPDIDHAAGRSWRNDCAAPSADGRGNETATFHRDGRCRFLRSTEIGWYKQVRLAGGFYTTAPATADCTVHACFRVDDLIFADGFEP